ncbi:GNAT family N-acetyltransferase [Marinobacteraceae bacterium S3BR75-40.1]
MSEPLSVQFIESLTQVAATDWDRLLGGHNPFSRHAFLAALEDTGCTSPASGWTPRHALLYRGNRLVGAMPGYLKTHSFGEYVFDWAWADAYERNGLPYYPKYVTSIPFTPSVGPRLGLADDIDPEAAATALMAAVQQLAERERLSSWHVLFPDPQAEQVLRRMPLAERLGCQFRWHNPGYHSWEDFLATLKARKRKMLRKERLRVAEQGIRLEWLEGAAITPEDLKSFYVFYQATYLKRGQHPYLNRAFFETLLAQQPEQLLLVQARHDGKRVAAALFLHDDSTLYGRYWGCLEEFDQLHFETCYYQGIDYCIERGLTTFDAGAQGEHKLLRGFYPVETRSYHWIRHPAFADAIQDFLEEEAEAIRHYKAEAETHLPYRTEEGN